MVIIVSLLTAVTFGAADFAGGLATRRTRIVEVVAGAHLIGLAGVFAAALVLADGFSWRDLALGALAGAFGGVGIVFLYRRLAVGPMSVVAPMTAVTSAVIPVLGDVLRGESFSAATWLGMLVAAFAIVLISLSDDGSHAPVTAAVVAESLLAGVGFGGFFIVIDLTEQAHAPWPIVGSRLLTALIAGAILLGGSTRITTRGSRTLGLIAAAGILDTLSNSLFLHATTRGDLAVVSVLSSLYPVSTVVLAAILLHERIPRRQRIGVLLALVATAAIALG